MAPKEKNEGPKKTIKTTRSLASPFEEPAWPVISPEDKQAILDLLCGLLDPIGRYRRSLESSKGKREKKKLKKRKRSEEENLNMVSLDTEPEIASHPIVGFNDTQKLLQFLNTQEVPKDQDDMPMMSRIAIFADRSSQPPIMLEHLPRMLETAARRNPEILIWLVTLPTGSDERLREALGIPKVGTIGVTNQAPGSQPLWQYLTAQVKTIAPSGMDNKHLSLFRPLKVETQTVEVEVKPPKSSRRIIAEMKGSKPTKQTVNKEAKGTGKSQQTGSIAKKQRT